MPNIGKNCERQFKTSLMKVGKHLEARRFVQYLSLIHILGKTVVEGTEKGDYVYDWVAYVDGAEQEVAGRPENEKDPTYEYTDKGATTEIYVDEVNETVTVVKINYYLAEITDIRSDDDGEFATVRMLGTQDPLGDSVDCLLYTSRCV